MRLPVYGGNCADPDLPAGADLRLSKALCAEGINKVPGVWQNCGCVGGTLISVAEAAREKEGVMCAFPSHDLKAGSLRSRTNPAGWLRLSEAIFVRGESNLLGVHENHFGKARTFEAEVARDKEGAVCTLLACDSQAGGDRNRTNPGDWLRLSEAMFARGESSLLGVHEVHFGEARTSDAEVAREKKGAVCALLARDLKPGSRRCRTDPGG
jgi:hypothetical protein